LSDGFNPVAPAAILASFSLPRPTFLCSEGRFVKQHSRCRDAQPGRSANGWSLDYAKGYVDGETFRLRGKKPSNYVLIGIDEYCLDFRAGYYERKYPI
jgi:hypothetical protein